MTEQEEIRRYLEDILYKAWRLGKDDRGIDLTEEAEGAIKHLSLLGMREKE